MNIALFLDEDVHAELSVALRKRGLDVLHAQEVERKGKTDYEQLFYAVKEHRCLFSYNVKDFVLLHNKFERMRQSISVSCFLNNEHFLKPFFFSSDFFKLIHKKK